MLSCWDSHTNLKAALNISIEKLSYNSSKAL